MYLWLEGFSSAPLCPSSSSLTRETVGQISCWILCWFSASLPSYKQGIVPSLFFQPMMDEFLIRGGYVSLCILTLKTHLVLKRYSLNKVCCLTSVCSSILWTKSMKSLVIKKIKPIMLLWPLPKTYLFIKVYHVFICVPAMSLLWSCFHTSIMV